TPDRLGERIGEADFVIVTTPETPETRGMFYSRLFSKMKRGSYFINISRGGCVVTEDLIAALRSGQLAGAGLDVVAPEPLPPDSPLWTMPNVLITPHVAISGAPYRQKWEEILLENCRRFANTDERLSGFVSMTAEDQNVPSSNAGGSWARRIDTRREWRAFREYYEEYLPRAMPPSTRPTVCQGPISYKGQALLRRELETF